jgi:hypothetical protein
MHKLRKIISLCLSVILILCCFAGCSQEEQAKINYNGLAYATFEEFLENGVHMHPEKDEHLRYAIYNNFVQVIECVSSATEITIPDTYKGLPVVGIRESAFQNRTELRRITIGQNILQIGANAFAGCTSLTHVNMSNSVNDIQPSAFQGCEALTSIIIPPSVKIVHSNTFDGCRSLKKVVIESSERTQVDEEATKDDQERTISSGAFSNCDQLRIMWIPEDIKVVEDSILGGSTPRPLICGGDSTASSYFATLQLLDYEVVNRDDFDAHARLHRNLDIVDRTPMGQSIESGNFNITLNEVKYYKKLGFTSAGDNHTLLVAKFTITQNTMIAQYFNGLDVTCTSTAPGKDNVITEFRKEPIMLSTKVLNEKYPVGVVYPESQLQGVIVLRVSERFESVRIQFDGAEAAFII